MLNFIYNLQILQHLGGFLLFFYEKSDLASLAKVNPAFLSSSPANCQATLLVYLAYLSVLESRF